jgi:hypothetical protein
MPLPIPNLDDTQFQEMVDGALAAIPRYAPEWTDYNPHDPGITFIELFAWLAEMQQYYLNRIRSDNYLRFLNLLGVRPADIKPAVVDIAFSFQDPTKAAPLTILQGAKLSNGTVVFETTEPLTMVSAALQKAFTVSSAGTRDNSDANQTAGISYMAFGDTAETGSALYLGFSSLTGATQPFTAGDQIGLTIFLSEDYPIPRGSHGTEPVVIVPSARILWEYYSTDTTNQWKPLNLTAALEPLLASLPSDCSGLCNGLQTGILNGIQQWPLFASLPLAAQTYITTEIQGAQSACDLRALASDPKLLGLTRDETVMLSVSGRFFFTAPGDMLKATLIPANQDPCFWIRARVAAQGYELPPRVNQILLNTVAAVQTDTRSEVIVFSSDGSKSQSFPVVTFLPQQGDVEVQVQQSPGVWQTWQPQANATNNLTYTFADGTLTFGNGTQGQIPPQGTDNIRLIACPPGSQPGRFIGQGNGLPNQQFPIPAGVVPSSMLLQTSPSPKASNPIWQDWAPVDNFDVAGPGDYQFVYDAVNGVVRFGDGLNGAMPPPPSPGAANVRWIRLQLTQGSKGNVSGVTSTPPPFTLPQNLTWTNVSPATGGADAETLAAAEVRARRDLKTPYRAVTASDYEYVSIHTPGLRVSRAHAIPPDDLSSTSSGQNTVSVVVVPYSALPQPVPSEGFLQTVCRHLAMHRLVTTNVKAIPPQYIAITVQATITLQPRARAATVQQAAIAELQRFLNALTGGVSGQGWPFGRQVYVSEVYQVLDGVAGVSCVQALYLSASAGAVVVPGSGDVSIPAESLVVSGNHVITVASGGGVCTPRGGLK